MLPLASATTNRPSTGSSRVTRSNRISGSSSRPIPISIRSAATPDSLSWFGGWGLANSIRSVALEVLLEHVDYRIDRSYQLGQSLTEGIKSVAGFGRLVEPNGGSENWFWSDGHSYDEPIQLKLSPVNE